MFGGSRNETEPGPTAEPLDPDQETVMGKATDRMYEFWERFLDWLVAWIVVPLLLLFAVGAMTIIGICLYHLIRG
jgi:bacteriorhodopsin